MANMRLAIWSRALILVVGVLLLGRTASAGPLLAQEFKLESLQEVAGDQFGQAVSIDGATVIVGSPTQGAEAGAAQIFVHTGAAWIQQQELTPDPGDGAFFGAAVAVSGDTAAVGAYGDAANGSFAGAVYVFVRSGTTWSLQRKITAPDAAAMDFFGYAVALSGDTLAVGALGDDDRGTESGSTYVYVRSGTAWSLQQKLVPADGAANDNFGVAVALDGDTLVGGAVGGSGTGAAYVYVRQAGTWSQQQKLLASGGSSGDLFGGAVALSGNTVVVGAYQDGARGANAGAAYVFARSGTVWSQQQKLLAPDGVSGDFSGSSVAVNVDRVVFGSPGASPRGAGSGAAYVFDRSGVTWSETQKIGAADGVANDVFGFAVALSATEAAVGADGRRDRGTSSGAAYVFGVPPFPAPALGDHVQWGALVLLVVGFLLMNRKTLRGGLTSVSGVALLAACMLSCGIQADSKESLGEAPAETAQALGPTTTTVTLQPIQDTSVRASAPDSNFGTAPILDRTDTLIQFSQTALTAALGPGDYVVGAQLEMTLVFNPLRRIPRVAEGHRLTQSWTEGGATFHCSVDSNLSNGTSDCSGPTAWSLTTPPNPWAPGVSGSVVVPATLSGVVRFDLSNDVRGFLHGDFSNFGWVLKGTTPGELNQFASRETATPPRLILTIRHCTPSACDDGNACTQDLCDATASCTNPPVANGSSCNDGNLCTQNDVCQAGSCVAGPPVVCVAPDQCHSASCSPATGACVASAVANGTACSDGDACTQADSCQAGACVGAPVICASSDGCHPGVCSHTTGACTNPLACQLYGVGSIPSSATDGLAVSPATLEDGTPHNLVGGLGSAIAYTGVGNLYIATPDRGPNNGLDSYTDRYYLIELALSGGTVTANLRGGATLNRSAGVPFTGLSSAFDATSSLRLDPEGVRVSPSGTFFVSDEYGPFLYEFGADGQRIRSLPVPSKFLIDHPNADGTLELPPGNTSGRQSNRGMEGLAMSPDGTRLFGIMQSPLIQDGALSSTNSRIGVNNRILEYDLATNVTHEYLYPMENRAYGVSEIVAVNDHQFLVDERDGNGGTAAAFKRVFFIDINGASDISGVASLPTTGIPAGVVAVTKRPFLDLLDGAYGLAGASFPEKIEGLAFGPDMPDGKHVLVITNDNDFLSTNNNNFYVFTIDPVALSGYEPQQASFSNACVVPSPVTCPGTDECHLAGFCRPDNAQCVPRTVLAGTPTSAQVPGDCHRNQCDANGAIVSAVDDSDVPQDSNQCTSDICSSGVPSHPPVPAGTACNQNGGLLCNGAGSCVQCLVAADCPGVDGECSFRVCNAGTCGIGFAPSGQPVAQQVSGDCHRNQCDGSGGVVSAVDDSDVPSDGNACTNDVCTGGAASNPPAPQNTPCSAGVCDGNGVCVGCTAAAQCPGIDSFCATRACNAGACGFSYTAAGTALPSQLAGDCRVQACDGAGNVVSNNDDTDVPVDGNVCTNDVCLAGVPSNPNVPYGTSCGTNLICSSGTCVDLTFRVVRFGDGSVALTSASAPVFVEERRVSDGGLVGTVAMPTAASGSNAPFSDSGSATSDGNLALSVDGRYLTLTGYAAVPGTAGVAGTASATTNRVVGRIDASGNVDTSTRFNSAFTGNNIRMAVSLDGSGFWAGGAGGSSGGTWFIALGATGGTQLTQLNTRTLGIFGNQLYGGSSSAPFLGVYTIGSPPLPTSGTQATTLFASTPSSYDFVLFDLDPNVTGPDTLYIADDGTVSGNTGGGVEKWTLSVSGGTWSRLRTFSTNSVGYRGLTGRISGSNVLLVATSAETSADRVVVFVDDGSPTVTGTTIATASTNTIFRGVAFSPHN